MAASSSDPVSDRTGTEAHPAAGSCRLGLKGSPEPIAALNRVRILEYAVPFVDREELVDVRTHCPGVQLSEHLCPFLRRTVADMLNAAQSALPAKHKLNVGTCLRTLSMQQRGWDNYNRKMRELHPEWPVSTLRRAVNKYFAPYDQPAPPGHCTGGAVDVGLLGPDGDPLDLLGPTEGWEAAYTWSDKIGDVAKANRMLMVEAMLNTGFSNCRDEYWHYSWGDSAWAVRTGVIECPYGWSHPPVTLDIETPEGAGCIEAVKTVRDQEGRPVHAEAVVRPDVAAASPAIRFRANWAKGVPLTIRLLGISASSSGDLHVFHIGDGEDVWKSVEEVYPEGDSLVLQITPRADRVIVSNFVTVPEPADVDEVK